MMTKKAPTVEQFRDWLFASIAALDHPEPDRPHFEGAAEAVREAGAMALRLGWTDLYERCRVRAEALGIDSAKRLLGDCLARCREAGTAAAELLSADDVARMLGISTRTVWRRRSAGELPEPLQVGGLTKWRRDDIEAITRG